MLKFGKMFFFSSSLIHAREELQCLLFSGSPPEKGLRKLSTFNFKKSPQIFFPETKLCQIFVIILQINCLLLIYTYIIILLYLFILYYIYYIYNILITYIYLYILIWEPMCCENCRNNVPPPKKNFQSNLHFLHHLCFCCAVFS